MQGLLSYYIFNAKDMIKEDTPWSHSGEPTIRILPCANSHIAGLTENSLARRWPDGSLCP